MKAQDIMTTVVRACRAEDSLERAARIMWDADLGCLPVLDDRLHPIGTITDRDITMAAYLQGRPLKDLQVASAMSRHVTRCGTETDLAEVQELMQAAQVRRIPVVSASGAIAGMLTLTDLVRTSEAGRPELSRMIVRILGAITEPRRPSIVERAAE